MLAKMVLGDCLTFLDLPVKIQIGGICIDLNLL